MHIQETQEHHRGFFATLLLRHEMLEVNYKLVQLQVIPKLFLLFKDHYFFNSPATHVLSSGPHQYEA